VAKVGARGALSRGWTGFGTWAAHVPVFKQFLHIENGSLTFVLISVIVGAIISMPEPVKAILSSEPNKTQIVLHYGGNSGL
jgi:hypothetical protein